MAKACVVTYKGKEHPYKEWINLLHEGELDRLIESKVITLNEKAATKGAAAGRQVTPTPKVEEVVEESVVKNEAKSEEELEKDQTKETQVLLNGEAEKRRKAGKFIKDTIEYVRNAVNKGVRGKKGEVKFAEGVPSMPFTYKLVEAEEVQPSHIGGIRNQMHFIPEAQPKNRNDEGSKAAEIGFANNPRFNEMGENTNAYSGAPVVNERNEVVQGNNRSAGLKLGYKQGVKKYKNDLIANAEKFGFTKEQVEGMKNPILVREVAFNDEGAIEFGNYDVKDLETGGKRRLDPVALVKRIPIKTKAALTKLLFTDEGTLNKSIRENSKKVLELISPFINQAQRNTLLKDGELSASGVQDIEAVVQQFLFDNGDMALPDFFEGLSHKQREGIRKSLPSIFSAGIDADIIPEIQNAILAVSKFEASGLDSMNNWLNQPDMFLDGKTPRDIYTPQELAIARLLIESKGQAEIIEKFKEFAKAVEGTPDTPATLLDEAIEGTKGQSKEEALKQIFNVQENESKQKDNTGSGKEADSKTPKTEQPKPAKATEKLTDPKNASDLAKTYRNKFKFSPKQSVWAARLFDAKAAFMSKVLGISKEDYYSQYWFGVNEGEGGLSQEGGFQTRDGKAIGFTYDTDKVARERFDFSNLKKIGSGSDRDVYDLGDGKVLKVAKTARGLNQNIYEGDFYLGVVPKVFERGLNYVVAENTPRIKTSDIVQTFDVDGNEIGTSTAGQMLKELQQFSQKDFDNKVSKLQDVLAKYGLQDIMSYEVLWNDFTAQRNWGYKDGVAYHSDGGTFGGVNMISSYKGKTNMSDPEFREIYQESKKLKKQFGDTDKARMYQDRKGSWTKDAARMKRIINMYEKADSTTAVHEMLGHDYLDRIIEASATNKESEADLRTIAEEYIKDTKSKEKVEDVIKALKEFNVESNKTAKGTSIHEWFARTAEGYFIGETQVKQGSKLAKIFEAFRAHLVELYNNMTNKSYLLPSNEMKKVFRKVFGEEHFDMLNEIAQEEIIQTKKDIARAVPKEVTKELADKFEALRKQAKGLGQTEEVSFDELLAAAQWLSTQEGVNVLSVLPELKAMFPANELMINENTKDFQQFFTPRGKKVSQTAQSAFDSPIVSEEGKQFVGDKLALYTPEKLKEVLSDVRKAFEDYSIENMMDAWLSGSLPYKELPVFLTELQFRVNRAIKATENGTKEEKEYRKRLISYEQKILDKIIEEGKSTAQRLNYFKIFKGMSTEGKIMHLKRNFNKANEQTKALLDKTVKSLKEKLGKAYEDIDYFFSQNQEAEEKIGSLTQEVSDLNKQIEAREKRKDREPIGKPKRPENFSNKISVSDALAKYKKAKGLGQDISSLSEEQTLAYALMQEKPKTIEQFVKEWNKATGEKRDITELEETYKNVREFATEVDGFEKDWFDTDSMIDESIEDYTNFKNDVELKKAKKDLELEIAKAEREAFKKQMSDKTKEVKAREALKKREKQIVSDFLNSLGQDGLWQKYVQSNAGKIVGNLASKIGGKPSEKALLDKFITLATNEINSAINELTPTQKGKNATPNYAQQLGDLISNQDKVAEVFDKAVKEFAAQYANDVNAQSLLSKLNGLKNPFSEGLLGKALEKEAENYTVKIKDLAFKYVGLKPVLKQQIIDQIVAETELSGQDAQQLRDDLAAKFESIISETETDVAGQLATALIADSKKTLGLMPKQSDYVKELLGYLKNKAKDYYKSENNATLVDPVDQLKYAVEMLNDANGKKIWDDSKAEIIKKIDADKTLSQTEKDNLKQHLDNYQNTVLDQLLSKNKLFNNIKKVLVEETVFVKNGQVDWNSIITQAKGNVETAKNMIRKSIEGKLQGYNQQQVDNVLDAIGREFDARINEKKADIIEKQLESIQGGKIIRKKKIAKGKVQKLIEMENSGALGDVRFEQELGKYLGMKEMTPQKWARLRELIVDAEEAPEGNERDRAIEKMAAYVKLNSVGKTAEIYTALYYTGMLARPTTIIKNATGISEPIIRLMYKALTDRKYAKMMLQGLKRGDAKDIWGGGLVQGSKLDEETGIDGMPRVNILKQWSEQTNNKFVKFVAGGARVLDLLTMADAISQAMVGSGAEYGNYVNFLLEENKEAIKADPTVPVLTKKQAREQAFNELTDKSTFDGAMMQAKSEFAKRGIIPSEARLKRRAYELTREMILPSQVRELAQNTALEEAYKSKLPSIFSVSGEKKSERRLTENAGIFTSLGSLANEIVQAISSYTGGKLSSAASVIPMSEARAKKLDENLRQVLAQRVLPFARGMSNVLEQSLEKTPYGIIKGGISLGLEYKNYRKPKSAKEALEHKYMMDRAKDKIAKSAASMVLGGVFYITVMAISKSGDDDDEEENRKLKAQGKPTNYRLKTGFYSAGEVVRYGKNNIEKFTVPSNCMVIGGRVIPLSLLGTQGMGASMLANMYDNFIKKSEKQEGKVKDPEEIESMQGYATFMKSMGNTVLSISALSSLSDLQESVSPTSNTKVSDYLSQMAVKSAVLPIPYVGTFGQLAQGARYLFGDKSAQTAIGLDERTWKEFGLQGIMYDRPVYNYRGKIVSAPQRNTEGIAGLVGMANKWKLDPIDNYLYKELNYNPILNKRVSEKFADKENYGMTKEDYYDYGKKVGDAFDSALTRNYEKLRRFKYTEEQISQIQKDEYMTRKQVLDGLTKDKKEFVSNLYNAIEGKYTLLYQFKKGVISNKKFENDKEKIIEKISKIEKSLGGLIKDESSD